jgi:putative membrane protein
MLSVVSLTILVLAQGSPGEGPRGVPPATPPDRQFLQDAAAAGRAEVEIAELAAKKASDPQVREFARHMADDHQTSNKELMQLAKRQGVSLPTAMASRHKALLHRLAKLEGAEFDRQYMDAMVNDHREVVARFEHEVQAGRDPDVKAFAERTLPTLRHHLELAVATAHAAAATAGRK